MFELQFWKEAVFQRWQRDTPLAADDRKLAVMINEALCFWRTRAMIGQATKAHRKPTHMISNFGPGDRDASGTYIGTSLVM